MSLRLTRLLLAAGLFGLFGCATQVDKKRFNEAAAESFSDEPDFKPVEPMEDYSFNVLVKNVKTARVFADLVLGRFVEKQRSHQYEIAQSQCFACRDQKG